MMRENSTTVGISFQAFVRYAQGDQIEDDEMAGKCIKQKLRRRRRMNKEPV
jgi:hypothetical protein